MKPGTARLSEVARHVVQPSGIVSTGWPAVRRTCRDKLGIQFDEWQDGAGRLALAKRADGNLAHTVDGFGMSVCRQVGKTYFWAGTLFGLSVNMPGLLAIWSAHHARTHGETFLAMQAFAKRPKIAPYIAQVYTGSGDEEVRFRNGSRILFGARESGFGIGIPAVDVLMMDEAQILSEKAMENMLATMNTSQLGLHAYVGTPPTPASIAAGKSDVFMRMREQALSGESEDLVWIECGADEDCDPDDRRQWAKANPSFPHRTPETSILRLRRKLTPDGFLRQGLGIWPSEDLVVFDLARWGRLVAADAEPPSRVALVVDVAPDRKWSCIGVAGQLDHQASDDAAGVDRTLVLCHSGAGTDWVAPKVAELVESRDVAEVGLVVTGQAKGLQPDFVRLGVEFVKLTTQDMGAACSAFQDAVKFGTVAHVGQGELDTALSNARTRYSGETQLWDRREQSIDISPLVACSAAFYRWGLQEAPLPAIY